MLTHRPRSWWRCAVRPGTARFQGRHRPTIGTSGLLLTRPPSPVQFLQPARETREGLLLLGPGLGHSGPHPLPDYPVSAWEGPVGGY